MIKKETGPIQKRFFQTRTSEEILNLVLKRIGKDEKLLFKFVERYVKFNQPFGGCVARLSSLFIGQEGIPLYISSEIASCIFEAAIDEFKYNHVMMAQDFLGILNTFGIEPCDVPFNPAEGYITDSSPYANDLIKAIGFHIGSELLADIEFNMIDRHIKDNFPDLCLTKQYKWISIHTTVEEHHTEHAINAANILFRAPIKNIVSQEVSRDKKQELIFDGYNDFQTLQQEFFLWVLRSLD